MPFPLLWWWVWLNSWVRQSWMCWESCLSHPYNRFCSSLFFRQEDFDIVPKLDKNQCFHQSSMALGTSTSIGLKAHCKFWHTPSKGSYLGLPSSLASPTSTGLRRKYQALFSLPISRSDLASVIPWTSLNSTAGDLSNPSGLTPSSEMSILLVIFAGCYLYHRFITRCFCEVISDIYGQSCFDSSDIFFVWTGCNFFHRMFAQFLGVVISDNWCRAIWLLGQMFLLVMAGYNFFHHMFTQWLEVVILTLDVKLFDSLVRFYFLWWLDTTSSITCPPNVLKL